MMRVLARASEGLDKIVPEFCPSICHAVFVSMPESDGKRLRFRFTIEECPSQSPYRQFTPASWPRCGVRLLRVRLARSGGRLSTRSGRSFAARTACGQAATTFFSTTTRDGLARRYFATSVLKSHARLKLRARCTRPKRQRARLPSLSTAAHTTA